MKNGYKHKTGMFGTDAEMYIASLFQMVRNKQGHRRPDLISPPGRCEPRLTMEVKSGRASKGILVRYQLHYAITSQQDYKEEFGEDLPPVVDPTLLPGLPAPERLPPTSSVAYYYNVVDRDASIDSAMLDRPFATVQLRYGNQCIVPAEFGFWAFAVSRHMRTGESMSSIRDDLRNEMKKNVLDQRSNYKDNKDSQSWQDIHGRDIMALWHRDPAYTTKDGKTRVNLMEINYPDLPNLDRIKIPGPSGTQIYVLAEAQHKDLFDVQLRGIVQRRVPVLDRIINSRSQSRGLLAKILPSEAGSLVEAEIDESHFSLAGLTPLEINRLRRLSNWLDRGESALAYAPI